MTEDGGASLAGAAGATEPASIVVTALDLLNSYAHVLAVAFVVTLLATPVARRIAFAAGVVDRPDSTRKMHGYPVAYLGGVAVFLGLLAGIIVSLVVTDEYSAAFAPVPIAIVIGMVAIMATGLADDVWGWDPRLKIAGQLVAAAALAINDVGVRAAQGMLTPIMGAPDQVLFTLGSFDLLNGHIYYWAGTALIAVFVLGGCNSANLIDGLDGLLSGVVAIMAVGLLAISLLMVSGSPLSEATESLGGARIVLSVALLGTVLGFLPYNWRPATIFLGDSGSLLLGFVCATLILMLGEHGQTHLVFAGLIIFAVPIMDTTLAMIRRWMAGTPIGAADNQHVHHQLRRALGGVRRAVLALYGITALFTLVGVTLAWLIMGTELRVRVIYVIALVLFGFIGVVAVKAARAQKREQERKAWEKQRAAAKSTPERADAES